MEFLCCTSLMLSIVLVFVSSVYLSFANAVSQNGVMPGTCIGNGGFDDSCPTGMYCDSNIGGTCTNCSKCYTVTFLSKRIPLKCQCDSTMTASPAICETLPAEGPVGILIESEEDVDKLIPNNVFNDFKGYFDGSASQYLPCPEPTTSPTELTTRDMQVPSSLPTPIVQDVSYGNSSENNSSEQCKDPGDPINGYKKLADHTNGGTIEFECNKSYSLQGKKFIYCMEDGEWSDKVPACDKEIAIWIVLVAAVGLFLVVIVLVLLAICCCRHKVQSGSMDCITSHRSDAENPLSTSYGRNCGGNSSENKLMLPELCESNSEETTGSSSSSGTRSCSGTPENTSALYLTDEDLTAEPLVTTNNQQSIQMDSVCSPSIQHCTEKLTEGAWTTMRSSLITLLEHEEFKKVFLQTLFMDTLLSEDSLNNLCSLPVDGMLITAVREQTEIQDRDSYETMGRTLMDSSLRKNYPEKRENMKELMQLLNDSLKSCRGCREAVPHSSGNSTVV